MQALFQVEEEIWIDTIDSALEAGYKLIETFGHLAN